MLQGISEQSHKYFTPRLHEAGDWVFPYGVAARGMTVEDVIEHAALPIANTIYEFGDSYRRFGVAALIIATQVYRGKERLVFAWATNTKLQEGFDPAKICAEPAATFRIEALGCTSIDALVVAAMTQADDTTHIGGLTLPLCGNNCREYISNHPLTTPDTPIITSNPMLGVVERTTIGNMLLRFNYRGMPDVEPVPYHAAA